MNYRYMRVIVFFDLPAIEPAQKRAYAQFRKFLVQDGFFMMQESVYCKICPNQLGANALIEHIRKHSPKEGIVQVLTITEKQFAGIEIMVGDRKSDIVSSTERMIVL